MAWSGWGQSPQQPPAPAKRRSGTPQLVIGIVLIVLALISSANGVQTEDAAETAGVVFFRLALIAGGIVLIVIGARIKSRNTKADLAARQAQFGWQQGQPNPYGQQPGPYPQQPGQYGQQPGPQAQYGQQPGGPPADQGPYGGYGQPWQPGPSDPPRPPQDGNH
jgi:hypothetical protein